MKKNLLVIVTVLLFFLGCSEKEESKVVGFISLSNVDNNTFTGFQTRMEELGWVENKNIKYIVAGAAQSVKNLPAKVDEIVKQKPDLILVSSTPATLEVKKQTKDIPVVFCPVNDPVGAGILKDTNKPEENITGVRLPVGDYKRAEWLYQMVPTIKNVLIPFTVGDKSSFTSRDNIKTIADELGFKIIEKSLASANEIDSFIKAIPENIDAVILPRDSLVESQVEEFVKYTINKKIPLSVPSYQQVEKGALYTFGFIHQELGKDAAMMADKILKSVKVQDLSVRFGKAYLVVNESTANKIGLKLNNEVYDSVKLIVK